MANDSVWCEINDTGRLLAANNRFCRMFGFDEHEIPWHYIKDLYRYTQDWESFKKYAPEESSKICFFVRLKNRSGRSYKCYVERSSQLLDGSWKHRLEISKVDAVADSRYLTCAV